MKKNSNITIMCEIALIGALGYVFDEFQSLFFKGIFINGGSIGFAMIAVLIMAFRRGLFPALLTGLIMGLLDVATSAYIIHPVQLLLDYIFPYAFVGFVGLFRPLFKQNENKNYRIICLIVATLIGGLFKLLSHYLAGVIFWSDPTYFAWDLNSVNLYLYCFIYNIAFIGPSIIITAILLVALYITAPRILVVKNQSSSIETNKTKHFPKIISVTTIIVGLLLFIYFLIAYIKSFNNEIGEGYIDYHFNEDNMVLLIVGIFVLVLGIYCLINSLKQKFNLSFYYGYLCVVLFIPFVYALTCLIKMYVNNTDPLIYWIWLVGNSLILFLFISLFIYQLAKKKKLSIDPID